MGKFSLMAVSLVAAIPAGIASTLLVIAFLRHASAMNVPFYILGGGGLALFAFITVIPVGILIFSPKPEAAKAEEAAAGTSAELEQIPTGSAEIMVAPMTGEFDATDAELTDDGFEIAEDDALSAAETGEIEVADSGAFNTAMTGEIEVPDPNSLNTAMTGELEIPDSEEFSIEGFDDEADDEAQKA